LDSSLSESELLKFADNLYKNHSLSQQLASAIRASIEAIDRTKKESLSFESEHWKTESNFDYRKASRFILNIADTRGWNKSRTIAALQRASPTKWIPNERVSLLDNIITLLRELDLKQQKALLDRLSGEEVPSDPFLAGIMKGEKDR
jgi:hypothetical protein